MGRMVRLSGGTMILGFAAMQMHKEATGGSGIRCTLGGRNVAHLCREHLMEGRKLADAVWTYGYTLASGVVYSSCRSEE